jgi:hypothetical protein
MAYESGTYTDMHDLLSKINTFLLANGWSVNSYIAEASGYESWGDLDYTGAKRLHVQKTAGDGTVMYFNFKAVTSGIIFREHYAVESKSYGRYNSEVRGIGINGSTGYSGGSNWDEQPGGPTSGSGTDGIGACITEIPTSGTNNYYIFQNGDVVVVAAEISTGRYMYLSFGCMTKSGAYTGGQFYAASVNSYYPSIYFMYLSGTDRYEYRTQFFANVVSTYNQAFGVYLNVESDAGWRHCGREDCATPDTSEHSFYVYLGGQAPYTKAGNQWRANVNNFIYARGPNHFNGVAVLAPIYTFCKRANLRYAYLGYPEGVRCINITEYNPGDEIIIGSDTWTVLPAFAKTDEDSGVDHLNAEVGFAFLKVV